MSNTRDIGHNTTVNVIEVVDDHGNTIELRILGRLGIVPPYLRISDQPSDEHLFSTDNEDDLRTLGHALLRAVGDEPTE